MTNNAKWWATTVLLAAIAGAAAANLILNLKTRSVRNGWYGPTISNDDAMIRGMAAKLGVGQPPYAKPSPATQP